MKTSAKSAAKPTIRLPLIEPGASTLSLKRKKAFVSWCEVVLGLGVIALTLAGVLAMGGYRFGGLL